MKIFKILYLAIFLSGAMILSRSLATAQTPSVTPEFTYPVTIVEGVTCNSKEECRLICDDPVYKTACQALRPAESKISQLFANSEFTAETESVLGCSTAETCREICQQPDNYQSCHQIAEKYQLGGGYDQKVRLLSQNTDENTPGLSEEARLRLAEVKEKVLAILGEVPANLRAYCAVSQNQTLCDQLAKEIGVKGGHKLEGPGGCQTAQSCRTYCENPENIDECTSFEIPGVNGCRDEQSCQTELEQNPESAIRVERFKQLKQEFPHLVPERRDLRPGVSPQIQNRNEIQNQQRLPNDQRREQPLQLYNQTDQRPPTTPIQNQPIPNTDFNTSSTQPSPYYPPPANTYDTTIQNNTYFPPPPTETKQLATPTPTKSTSTINSTTTTTTNTTGTYDSSTQVRGAAEERSFWRRLWESLF